MDVVGLELADQTIGTASSIRWEAIGPVALLDDSVVMLRRDR